MRGSCAFPPVIHSDAGNSITDAYGGPWKHTLFPPLFVPSRPPPALHVVFTVYHSTGYVPTFEDAKGFWQYSNKQLPEANHFVPLSNDNASLAYTLAVDKFRELKNSAVEVERAASAALCDGIVSSQDDMTFDEQEEFLDGLTDSAEQVWTATYLPGTCNPRACGVSVHRRSIQRVFSLRSVFGVVLRPEEGCSC